MTGLSLNLALGSLGDSALNTLNIGTGIASPPPKPPLDGLDAILDKPSLTFAGADVDCKLHGQGIETGAAGTNLKTGISWSRNQDGSITYKFPDGHKEVWKDGKQISVSVSLSAPKTLSPRLTDPGNLAKIQKLHPDVRGPATAFIAEVEQKLGIKLQIVQSLRTNQEQSALYAKGRTEPGSVVTNAKAGQSSHNFGLAIDVFPVLADGKVHFEAKYDKQNIDILKQVAPIAKKHGFEWGGDWKSFKDHPHFEMRFGNSLPELRQKLTEANGKVNDMEF
jgi:D-alanyl-D-alanine carboxypeptidase